MEDDEQVSDEEDSLDDVEQLEDERGVSEDEL
jgi:hypothetical protein